MKKEEKGFVASGILYTILIIFLVLMMTILISLSSRRNTLEQLKSNALESGLDINDISLYESVAYRVENASNPIYRCTNWYVINKNKVNNTVTLLCQQPIGDPITADIGVGVSYTFTPEIYESLLQSNPQLLNTNDMYWMFSIQNNESPVPFRIINGTSTEAGGTIENSITQNITAKFRPVTTVSVNNIEITSRTGIPAKNYSQGDIVIYLGSTWKVIQDNGNNSTLIRTSVLSYNEIMSIDFSGIGSPAISLESQVEKTGKVHYCLYNEVAGTTISDNLYCYQNQNNASLGNPISQSISWDTSLVKIILDRWINKKMQLSNKTQSEELVGDITTPTYDDVKSPPTCVSTYCLDKTSIYHDANGYFLKNDSFSTTTTDNNSHNVVKIYTDRGTYNSNWIGTSQHIKPVLTVKEV